FFSHRYSKKVRCKFGSPHMFEKFRLVDISPFCQLPVMHIVKTEVSCVLKFSVIQDSSSSRNFAKRCIPIFYFVSNNQPFNLIGLFQHHLKTPSHARKISVGFSNLWFL